MKVLFVTNLYPTKSSPDYGVFTKDQIEKVIEKGITGKIIFINAKENGIKEYFYGFKKIREIYKNYDLIHCFHGLTLIIAFFATRKISILISFLNEIKYENYKNNYLFNSFFVIIYKVLIRFPRVYTIFKDKIPQNLINNNKSFYLPNGIDLNKFYPIERKVAIEKSLLDTNKTYVLFVSSKDKYRKQKRYDIFSETLQTLKQIKPEYKFEELVLTNIDRELCIYYYNAASVHLLTSEYEGSPNSVKESMSCNTPIVSTDVGNVKLMIKGAKNCFISKQTPIDLAHKVIRAIESPSENLRDILKKNGLTVEAKTDELISIYNKIKQ